jgi:anti-sigma factor RsiW
MITPTRPSARCRTLLLAVSRYLDGDLTPARRRAVERHLETCRGCGTMAARLLSTIAACRAAGQRPPPRAVMSRAEKRVRTLIARESEIHSLVTTMTASSPGLDGAARSR